VRIKIYQINKARDALNVKFSGLREMQDIQRSHGRAALIDPTLYDEVFSGEVDCRDLEGVYTRFNTDHSPFFRGHSLSISDIVQVDGYTPEFLGVVHYQLASDFCEDVVFTDREKFEKAAKETLEDSGVPVTSEILRDVSAPAVDNGCYFCDEFSFTPIRFDSAQTHKPDNLLRVVAVESGRPAYEAEISNSLRAFQQAVRGNIEVFYPFDDDAVIICNEDGKIDGLPLNRVIHGETMVGNLVIVGDDGEGEFRSLTDEQTQQYLAEFSEPQVFPDESEGMGSGMRLS
jgi:hypothetical protein